MNIIKAAKAAIKTEVDSVTSKPIAPVETNNVSTEPLTPAEAKLLAQHETTIRTGLSAFKPVYFALQEICDQRLYRAKYATFEEYCRVEWDITARHANRIMSAGAVAANLESDQLVSSVPAAVPENEGQARPLASLAPEQQVKAARIVAKKPGKHTAKDFQEAARAVSAKSKAPAAVPKSVNQAEVQSQIPNTKTSDLEKLLELLDKAQTQAKRTIGCSDVAKALGELASTVTKKLNGGGK